MIERDPHNHFKFTDNGLKIFDKNGNKLSDEIELEIERLMGLRLEENLIEPEKIGRAKRLDDANGRYIEFLKNTFPSNHRLEGLKVVIDCANGASYLSAPIVFWELGAEVIQIGVKPDGLNINPLTNQIGKAPPSSSPLDVQVSQQGGGGWATGRGFAEGG